MSKQASKLNTQILEEASSWFIDLNEGDPDTATLEEFNTWLRRSPEHVRAFLQISAMMEDAGTLKRSSPDLEALMARAREEANVFPLEVVRRASTTTSAADPAVSDIAPLSQGAVTRSGHARRLALAAAMVLAIGVGLGTWLYTERNVYTTRIGEQRFLTLEDGSLVELNAVSRLKVSFTEHERAVELLAGQALFKVARNPARPFVVHSGEASVRAVGTAFDVYRKTSGTVVTVIEGKVTVAGPTTSEPPVPVADTGSSPLHPKPGEVLLAAGEQLTVPSRRGGEAPAASSSAAAAPEPKPVDVETTTAWTAQKVVFKDTPLREAVEELNRYNRQQLVLSDPSLADFQVTGVFASADSNRLLELLRLRFHVTITRSGDQVEITRGPSQ